MPAILTILGLLLAALVLCLGIAVIRTLTLPQKQTYYELSQDSQRVDAYAEKLSKMVQMETISDRADPAIEKFFADHGIPMIRYDEEET